VVAVSRITVRHGRTGPAAMSSVSMGDVDSEARDAGRRRPPEGRSENRFPGGAPRR
jgi:hypothetical protein